MFNFLRNTALTTTGYVISGWCHICNLCSFHVRAVSTTSSGKGALEKAFHRKDVKT